MEKKKPNRKRTIRKPFFLSDEEEEIVRKKMAEEGCTNFSEFMRKRLIDVNLFVVDDSEKLKEFTIELNKIGNKINDIARNVNTYCTITSDELKYIKDGLVRIWQYQNYILSHEEIEDS